MMFRLQYSTMCRGRLSISLNVELDKYALMCVSSSDETSLRRGINCRQAGVVGPHQYNQTDTGYNYNSIYCNHSELYKVLYQYCIP